MASTFTAQSKIRPGAYVNFKSVSPQAITPGVRGIVAIPLELSWGDVNNLIEVTAEEYVSGQIFEKLGVNPGDASAIPLREIFKNAAVALVGRLNSQPVAASANVTVSSTEITFTAKYPGTLGNSITVSCVKNAVTNALELVTTVGGVEVDRQVVTTVGSYTDNAWFKITGGTENLVFEEFAGTILAGGTNGSTVQDAQYVEFMNKCSTEIWNVMAIPSTQTSLPPLVTTYIQDLRDKSGKKVQAVVYNYPAANHEGIISVDQGYMIGDEEVSYANFVAYVAGATAGASIVESNTFKVVNGATKILNHKSAENIELGLQRGQLLLSMRQDKSIVIEKDINTLHTFTPEKNYVFSKNRVIRCLDDIATQISSIFETSYIGKVSNNESGRTLFKGAVVGYLNDLQAQGAIQNFDSATDISIAAGNDIESVVCNVAIQPVDSMEKLYMTVVMS